MKLAERVGQEWPSRIEHARLDVKMGIRSLSRPDRIRCPVEGQELCSIQKCELVPILDGLDPVRLIAAIGMLDDAEFLTAGEGKRLVTSKRHRIVSVQDDRVDGIEL